MCFLGPKFEHWHLELNTFMPFPIASAVMCDKVKNIVLSIRGYIRNRCVLPLNQAGLVKSTRSEESHAVLVDEHNISRPSNMLTFFFSEQHNI